MGGYLNPGSKGFRERLNSAIYVDKTALIERTKAVPDTRQNILCSLYRLFSYSSLQTKKGGCKR